MTKPRVKVFIIAGTKSKPKKVVLPVNAMPTKVPAITDADPTYGPRRIPYRQTTNSAAVKALPCPPIQAKIGTSLSIAYNAPKDAMNIRALVLVLVPRSSIKEGDHAV